MPILESEIPLEVMKKRAQTHKCGVCGGMLVVCWGGAYGYDEYILRCAENFDHDTLSDYTKPSKEYEEGEKLFRRLQGMDTTALMKMTEDTMLARISQAKFPADLTPEDKKLLAVVSISYGLDPLMNELMIYQGNPYPTINARYRKAQETGKFDGINTRPATAEERKARNCKEGDFLYCAEVWVIGASHPFIGWGRVRGSETKGSEFLPIVKDPDRQAEKRAEAMGLRKGFSMPVPFQSWEEFEEQRAKEVINVKDVGKVHKGTGEIIEGEGSVVEEPEPSAAPEQKEHWCEKHNCPFEKKVRGTSVWYSHKLPGGGWCNEGKPKETTSEPEPEPVVESKETISEETVLTEEPEPETPPAKDETPITPQQLNSLDAMMIKTGANLSALSKYIKKDKGWTEEKLGDLKCWQFNEIMDAFDKGQDEPPPSEKLL